MNTVWRYIDHPPADASWNMAVDEAILTNALDGELPPTIRFFRWQKPSITFGYMVKVDKELNVDLCRKRDVPFIRRITGGGVVFHGCDITYSVIFPKSLAPETSSPLSSYRLINHIFVRALEKIGIEASLLENKVQHSRDICFVEPTEYDVLYKGKKLIGNAQRRRKDWVLNHGSILFDTGYRQMADLIANLDNPVETFSKNSISLQEILPDLAREKVITTVIEQFEEDFDVKIKNGDLINDESSLAAKLSEIKYSTAAWNMERKNR